MTTKRAKKRKAPYPSEPKPPRVLKQPTLMHFTYHPEAGIVRANVQQDSELVGITQRHGRDIDVALDDLSDDIRAALEDAFKWIADDQKAVPFEREE